PRRGGAHGAHRPGRHAHHRRGRGGQTAGQEGQTVVVALRWGEVAGRGRYAGGDFPGPAVTVLRARRGGGRARRDEHAAVVGSAGTVAGELATDRDHPPEADDGDRGRVVRGEHAGRRDHAGHFTAHE